MNEITGALEALLLMATEPVPSADLAAAVGEPVAAVEETLAGLASWYAETGRGFQLRNVGGGWRYYTHPDHHELISAWVTSDAQAKLSQAALETLAVIAYQQPVSRSRVSAVRGVNVDGVVRTLTTRGLVEVSGNDPETGAALLVTTPLFLERMGLNSLEDLPPLAPNLPDAVQLEAELAALAETVPGGAEGP
ncbi:MAG: SMC-Scp complex subunit ScpB [Propionibacteriaceae bacterium]|nr:SMC-Scp complex subunit ScpB [Propionibacteriaceae bacterium]